MKDCWLKRFLLKNLWALDDRYTDFVNKHGRIQANKIVFDSYGGKGYGDNPKYIAEEIHRQGLNWDMVWLVNDLSLDVPSYLRKVLYYSNEAKRELATAKVFVTNFRSGIRPFAKRNQIYLQTWHGGLGFKQVEAAVEAKLNKGYVDRAKRDGAECDAIISACAMQSEDYKQNFWLSHQTEILEFGQPRCDALFLQDVKSVEKKVRKQLDIPENKEIIIYAPTFRDEKTVECFNLDFQGLLGAFEKKTGKEYVMIIRLHPNIQHLCTFLSYNERIINGSNYPDIQELLLVADALITDYSSTAFDFALLGKPVFLCMLDYEQYGRLRGFSEVFSICPFPKAYSNTEMIEKIECFSEAEYTSRYNKFKTDIWRPFDDGYAAQRTVEWLKRQVM